MEVWKDVVGYEGFYQVSNYGRVKSLPRNTTIKSERILKPAKNTKGYLFVGLYKNGVCKYKRINRLVAIAFICESDLTVNHKDGNKQNNHVDNLEWLSIVDNIRHGYKTGLYTDNKRSKKVKLISENETLEFDSYVECSKHIGINISSRFYRNKLKIGKYTIERVI